MTKIEELILKEREVAKTAQDFYFEKYQKTGNKEAQEYYLEYKGQETAFQRALDILAINKIKE